MTPLIVLLLVQAGVMWLTLRLFGFNVLSFFIAVLAVLNLCPWFTPYETAEPFLLGQPWWLTVWMGTSLLLVILLYVRLFRVRDRHGTAADLDAMWKSVDETRRLIAGDQTED